MEVPRSNNTGIEMEQDFQADAVSLSEDSGENEDSDGENEELESEMGQTGPDSEAVGEKIWDKNDDETPNDTREKYESGPSVRDRDGSNKQLRGKDDATSLPPMNLGMIIVVKVMLRMMKPQPRMSLMMEKMQSR